MHEHLPEVDDLLSHIHILQRLHWQLLTHFQMFFLVLWNLPHLIDNLTSALFQLRAQVLVRFILIYFASHKQSVFFPRKLIRAITS